MHYGGVGAPFEPEEATTLRAQPPLRALVRRSLLFLAAVWATVEIAHVHSWAVRSVIPWQDARFPLLPETTLLLRALTFGLAALVVFTAARFFRVRRRMPHGTVVVRADEGGLIADGRTVVAREDIAAAEVVTDPDLGFAVVVRRRGGDEVRIPLRSEADAHRMATALHAGHDAAGLVFEGLSVAGRRRPAMAAGAVLVLAVLQTIAVPFLTWPLIQLVPGPLEFLRHPESLRFWLVFLQQYSALLVGLLSVPAGRQLAARWLPGRVRVDARGVELGEGKRLVARGAIAGVETTDASAVSLALRDGTRVQLTFAADRPLVEREAFVARVRAFVAEPEAPAYSAVETSGVRVAIPVDSEGDPEEEPAAQAPRARRRG